MDNKLVREDPLTVGSVAKRCAVKVSTLHFYESKGLIKSTRNIGNQRRYNRQVLRRVSLIKAAQKMGITLSEIKEQLDTLNGKTAPNQEDWQRLSMHWKDSLNERIQSMQKLRDYLSGCIGCGCLSMDACPLYNENDKLATIGNGAVLIDNLAVK
ncbi:redox-sensitive transcriptional activator SoxR [Psychromonas sp. 14N.309.X.WAT.B.A12]|uniref:redox-sensitive transcriptional activator SoxR n=1 Tax=Psychromonas sp. 14N.309.X.WAT.B.A12 TaxID=2998322 RepID=UPI0025AF5692|nr:redox-sensitive transcriptional activator SoxR [Psychromonas sp. 14N.309.X.WAT.B.A12]MDN2662275.1 redox-sensitive transcriptional activator SoxR [Psychromonas sp. 14N.309.X.WAT.B.A12]